MGPYQWTPKEVARAIRYSGLGVRVLLEISWKRYFPTFRNPIRLPTLVRTPPFCVGTSVNRVMVGSTKLVEDLEDG